MTKQFHETTDSIKELLIRANNYCGLLTLKGYQMTKNNFMKMTRYGVS